MAVILSAADAMRRIPDGATVWINPVPSEELYTGIEQSFLERARRATSRSSGAPAWAPSAKKPGG
jgi:hypothetical protein